MRKLIISLLLIAFVLFVIVAVVHTKISVDVTDQELPQDVYENDGNLLLIAQSKLIDIVNPLNTEDEYTLTEEFVNYMLLYSIRENVNADYNPLDDTCDTDDCNYIVRTEYGNIEYAFASLNEDNQLVVVVSLYREDFPTTETALYVTFDIDISLTEMAIILTLDTVFLSDIEITKDNLDTILSFFDPTAIEDSIALGELDLENYTYTVSLNPF